jgi:hypothetical protein
MKAIHSIAAAVALCIAGIAPALAQSNALLNPSFTTGLTSWDTFGDVTVTGATNRAVLSTASTMFDDDGVGVGANNNSGTTPVDLGSAPDLAGIAVGQLDQAAGLGQFTYEGSAIRQSFAANAGDLVTVTFSWAFLSLETTASDFAFVALNNDVVKFADATSVPLASNFTGAFADFNSVNWVYNTGSYTYNANSNGTQSFALGVVDVNDYTTTSELRVDNISVQITAVPEPETFAMLLAGLGLVGGVVRRRQARLA